jgi:hypothetical protein
MELASCHAIGFSDFEVATRFLENPYTLSLINTKVTTWGTLLIEQLTGTQYSNLKHFRT